MAQKAQKLTKKEIVIKTLFENHGHISKACDKANIPRRTYYNWRRDDPDFAANIDLVEEDLIDYAKSKLMENIKKNDTTSIIFFLKTKGKDHGFSERQEVRLTKPISDINFEEI